MALNLPFRGTYFALSKTKSKTVVDSGFPVGGTWIPDSMKHFRVCVCGEGGGGRGGRGEVESGKEK